MNPGRAGDAAIQALSAVVLVLASFSCLVALLPGLIFLSPAFEGMLSDGLSIAQRLLSLVMALTFVSWFAGPLIGWVLFRDGRPIWAIGVVAWPLVSSIWMLSGAGSLSSFGPG